MTGFVITALSAIAWASLDAMRKSVGDRVSASTAVAAMAVLQLPFVLGAMAFVEVVGPFSEPWSGILGGFPPIELDYFAPYAGTLALNILANWLFLRAVQLSPLGLTIPYLSFTPVFTLISGLLVLGQAPTIWGIVGVAVVALGAFSLNGGDLSALKKERGSMYMIGVAALWSISPPLDKIAVDRSSVMAHTAFLAAGIFAAFFVMRAVRDRSATRMVSEFRVAPVLLGLMALLTVVALVLQLWSYSYLDIAYVETVKRAIGVLTAVIIGWRIFGEGELGRRLLAAAVMAVGVAIIMIAG